MHKKITTKTALFPITITVILLVSSATYLDIPLYVALLIGYIITFVVALFYNNKTYNLFKNSIEGIKSISTVFFILILIGILIAIWTSSGTIDTLVYYGLNIIKPEYLVIISFLISTVVSLILGTSVGTISTVGVAFIGIAESLGINTSLVAGALVSGAFIGDRTSPLSSVAHINAIVTETNYYGNIKELLKTLIPAMLITAIIYLLLGYNVGTYNIDESTLNAKNSILESYKMVSPVLLLPPVILMILSIFKVPIKINFLISILIGSFLAYIFQDRTLYSLLNYSIFGFQHFNGNIYGGGWNMFNQVLLVVIAGAYYGLLETSGILAALIEKLTTSITNSFSVIKKTMAISITSALLSSTQIMGILIPGKVMLKYYKDFNIDKRLLNRVISDSGMVVSGLIPWNLNAILLGIALHIPVIDYAPYAFLLFILPLYSYLTLRIKFKNKG